jgi:hypothetical protein
MAAIDQHARQLFEKARSDELSDRQFVEAISNQVKDWNTRLSSETSELARRLSDREVFDSILRGDVKDIHDSSFFPFELAPELARDDRSKLAEPYKELLRQERLLESEIVRDLMNIMPEGSGQDTLQYLKNLKLEGSGSSSLEAELSAKLATFSNESLERVRTQYDRAAQKGNRTRASATRVTLTEPERDETASAIRRKLKDLATSFKKIRARELRSDFDSQIDDGNIPSAVLVQFAPLSKREREQISEHLRNLLTKERIADLAKEEGNSVPLDATFEDVERPLLERHDNHPSLQKIPNDRIADLATEIMNEREKRIDLLIVKTAGRFASQDEDDLDKFLQSDPERPLQNIPKRRIEDLKHDCRRAREVFQRVQGQDSFDEGSDL